MSTYTISANRRPASAPLGRRVGVIALVLAVFTLMATAAWAYWSTTGNGTGSAVTGTLNNPIVAVSSTAGSGQVGVSWQAPTAGSAPTGYYVERASTGGGTPLAACSSSPSQLLTGTSCDDTSVPDGEYTYVVTAVLNSWTAASAPSHSVVVTNTLRTTTRLVSSANPSVVGQTVTYTATVTADSGTPTGTVAFTDDGDTITCANAGGQTLSAGQATCRVTYDAVGSHPITAEYSGATGFESSTSDSVNQGVEKASTTTGITSPTGSPSKAGQQVTYTATVSVVNPGAGTPTGGVTFKEGETTICADVAFTGTNASCSTTYSSVGSHSVTAEYGGDAKFHSSTSPAWNQGVGQAGTSTALSSSANPAVTGQPVIYTATVSVTAPGAGTPTGSVVFKNGSVAVTCGDGSQTFNGNTATCISSFASSGNRTVTAEYDGDGNFTGSTSNSLAQIVNKANTSTSLAADPSLSTTGQSVTLTATVSASAPGAGVPGGTVAFKDGATTITSCDAQPVNVSGVATCSTSFASAGGRTLTAEYSGNADYNASTGSTSHTVTTPIATTTSLTSSPAPSVKTGQTVTYTATVAGTSGTPSGTVTFKDGGTVFSCTGGNQTLSGTPLKATCEVSYGTTGTHTLTATYNGEGAHASSTSDAITQRVVNGNVAGIVFTNLSFSGAGNSVQTNCSGTGSAIYNCTITGANNNANLTVNVAFVNSAGAQTAYSSVATDLAYTRNRPSPLDGTLTVSGGASATSGTVTVAKQGNHASDPQGRLTVTLNDGANLFTATVTIL